MRRVVITGLGAVTPIGNNVSKTWENAKNGVCGVDNITYFDTSDFKVKLAAEVKNFDSSLIIGKQEVRKLDRFVEFAIVAAKEAYDDAKLNSDEIDNFRFGVSVSSGIGGLQTIEETANKLKESGPSRISPHFIPKVLTNLAAGNVAIQLGAKGVCHSVVTACAASTDAIGTAYHHIRNGVADIMIAGGAEASITRLGIAGFSIIKAVSESTDITRASIPFDKERNGFVMGEGAGMLILETLESAKKRGAHIYAEIVGYGATCDAYHVTAPHELGEGATRAMLTAINEAQITPCNIDYINAHGTSTPLNDKIETIAVKNAFKNNYESILMSSTKSMTGHMLGAAGAVEAILTIKSLESNCVLPTINSNVWDEACDLDYIFTTGRNKPLKYVMSNSLGFGGHNASIIFKKWAQ